MSYQVIARKWRPQSFDQLIGQNHISQTLTNALRNGRIPHALLFTGPRGTGKTSSARILAKSLRCPNAVDFVPCGVCDECKDIALGRSVNVMEIDGASNNGVDAIRELRETVSYAPSGGKFKIYIIDEVHMLSTSAFNALLKTLEEPPAHVVFIMATTEVHKIPQTILSRCQRFDFRSISTRQVSDSLSAICKKEGVQAEEDALWIIARQGGGSMRDSQSLLDQVITFANGPLTRENVVQILGLTDRALLLETLTGLANRDTDLILDVIEKIRKAGYEPGLYAKDLLENIRNLLMFKISKKPAELLELPESEIRFLESLAVDLSEEEIHMMFDMALKGASDIPKSTDPRIVLEMVLLRMVQAPKIVTLANLLQGGLPVYNTAASGGTASAGASSGSVSAGGGNSAGVSAATAVRTPVLPPRPAPQQHHRVDPVGQNPQDKWFEFVQKLRSSEPILAAKVESLLFLGEKNKVLDLTVPAKFAFLRDQLIDKSTSEKLQEAVAAHFGAGMTYQIQASKDEATGTSAQAMVQQKQKLKQDEIAQKVAEHPMVKSAQAAFKGQIKSIKNQQTS
ncbi:MAG: DNA polymerase III subunit gamma/tau [Pseudobdellovibrionaceae bacterium]